MAIDRDYPEEVKEEIKESSGKNSQAVTSGVSQKNSWGITK